MLDAQTLFNTGVGIICALFGWILRAVWSGIADLRKADHELTTKVQQIEVLVAGQYVTRQELEKLTGALFKKLDMIMEKLDGKADK